MDRKPNLGEKQTCTSQQGVTPDLNVEGFSVLIESTMDRIPPPPPPPPRYKSILQCGGNNRLFPPPTKVQVKVNMGGGAEGAGGAVAPPVFAKFSQNLPFLPQILAFLCLQPPHVPVSPRTFKFTPPSTRYNT